MFHVPAHKNQNPAQAPGQSVPAQPAPPSRQERVLAAFDANVEARINYQF